MKSKKNDQIGFGIVIYHTFVILVNLLQVDQDIPGAEHTWNL